MNKNVMKSAAFVLAASAIFFSTGCGGEAGSSMATPKKKLSVAVEASYAPFEYKDEDGHIIGFDVDLMKAVAQKMDAEAEFNNLPFEQIFHFVGDKKIQLGIPPSVQRKNVRSTCLSVIHTTASEATSS